MTKKNDPIVQTKAWIKKVVLKYQLCPFAQIPFQKDQIRYRYIDSALIEDILDILKEELEYLEDATPENTETCLLILGHLWPDFANFWDFASLAEEALIDWGYEGMFQLATFHPKYQFAGTRPEDASNFTNRSPFPILHLLREESVEKAIAVYPDIDMVPIRNMEKMEKKGTTFWQNLLEELGE